MEKLKRVVFHKVLSGRRWPVAAAALFLMFSLFAVRFSQAQNSDIKDRLNRIFYWQIADELKLSQKAERELTVIIDDIQKSRNEALAERQKCLDELKAIEKKISAVTAEPILNRYQNALTKLAKLDASEHERLKALLGAESLAKFYLVRESVALRVHEALRNSEKTDSAVNSKK